MFQKVKNSEFKIEKLLVQHGFWHKVEKHEDLFSCPLCEKKFEDGDLAVFCLGKPIHTLCIEKLEGKEKE